MQLINTSRVGDANRHFPTKAIVFVVSILLFLSFSLISNATNYYWIGGSGYWSQPGHWSLSSGGPSGMNVPTAADNVFFDSNSGFVYGNNTVTLDLSDVYCTNMDWTGAQDYPTLTGWGNLYIYGSLTFTQSMSFSISGTTYFMASTTGHTITTGNANLGNFVYFSGIGGGWTLLDDFYCQTVRHDRGTLNTNGKRLTCDYFYSDSANVRTLILDSSTIDCNYAFYFTADSLNFNAGTSTILFQNTASLYLNTAPGPMNFYDLKFLSNNPSLVYLYNYTGQKAIFHDIDFFCNAEIYGDFTVNGTLDLVSGGNYLLNSYDTLTVNGTITTAYTCGPLTTIHATSYGTPTYIFKPAGNLTCANLYLIDIYAVGGATFVANNSVDGGGNSGWTINGGTPTDLYWVNGGGDWSDVNHWSTTSGGTAGTCIPGPLTNVYFDANSFYGPGETVNIDQNDAYCRDMDWTGSQSPYLGGNTLHVFGSLTLDPAMSYGLSGYTYLSGQSTGLTLTTSGLAFSSPLWFNGPGTYSLADDLNAADIYFDNGIFITNDKTINANTIIANSQNTRVIHLGNSQINLQYSMQMNGGNCTVDGGTSTINLLSTNWNDLSSGLPAANLQLYHVNFSGPGAINGAWTFNGNLIFNSGSAYNFTSNVTQVMNGSIGVNSGCPALIWANSPGVPAYFSRAAGTLYADLLTITDIATTGGATFIATNSTGTGTTTGWTFTTPGVTDYYWIGGSGNWTDPAHWSASSGGPAATCIPTAGSNVHFDQNSGFTSGSRTVTLNTNYIYCNDMDWTGATASPILTGSYAYIQMGGSLTLIPAMSINFSGSITFVATSTGKTITTAGQSLPVYLYFNKAGGGWTLMDNLTSSQSISFYAGTLNTNGMAVTCQHFYTSGSTAKTLTLGNSYITIRQGLHFDCSGLTMNPGTSTFDLAATTPNVQQVLQVYNLNPAFRLWNVKYSNPQSYAVVNYNREDSLLFHDLSLACNSTVMGSNIIDGTLTLAAGKNFDFEPNQTTTFLGGMAVNASCGLMAAIRSNSPGTPTIFIKAAGSLTVSNVSLTDVTATGGAVFTANNSIAQSGVSGWNFTPPVISDLYWIGGSGNWNDPAHWSLTSGGTAGTCIPGPNTNVHFNGASGFTSGSRTVTVPNMDISCHDMDWTGALNNPIFTGGSGYTWHMRIYGSFTLIPSMSFNYTSLMYFDGTSTGNTITCAGKTLPHYLTFEGIGGGWTLMDALTVTNQIIHMGGTLNTNGQTVTCQGLYSYTTNPRSLILGNSTINPSYSFHLDLTGLTLDAGTSTINFTNAGGGSLYLNNPTASVQLYNINMTSTTGTLSIYNYTGGVCTINNVTLAGNCNFWGDNTYNGIIGLAQGMTYLFESLKTHTINGSVTVNGSCPVNAFIRSTNPGSPAIFSRSTGTLTIDHVTLADNTATGGASFIANNSVNGGGVTGWTINAMPASNYYWIGGSGNWSDASHWSLTSGGAATTCPPGKNSNVRFDANSGFVPGNNTVSIDIDSAFCHDMDWTGAQNTPVFRSTSSQYYLVISGSLKLIAAMSLTHNGYIKFTANTTGKTITSAGHTFAGNLMFAGNGGAWTLLDAFNSNYDLVLDYGTLITNNYPLTCSTLSSYNAGNRVLNLGNSAITMNSGIGISGTGLTINPGTSTINFPNNGYIYLGPTGANIQFNHVNFLQDGRIDNYSGYQGIFNNVTIARDGVILGDNRFDGVLTITAGRIYQLEGGRVQTINGSIVTMANCGYNATVRSTSTGWAAIISRPAGTLTADHLSLSDNKAIGGATFIANNSLNFGNVSGWTIGAITPVNLYWVGGSGNWKSPNHWSLSSGGAPSGCVPSPTANVFFDAGSGFTTGSTVTVDTTEALCYNMDWTGAANTPSFVSSHYSNNLRIYGSLKLCASMNFGFNGNLNFEATTTGHTITTAGTTIGTYHCFFKGSGEWVLQDNYTASGYWGHENGTINTNGKTVNIQNYGSSGQKVRLLKLGSSTFICKSWNASGYNYSLDAGTSVMSFQSGSGNTIQLYQNSPGIQFYDIEFTQAGTTAYLQNWNNGQNYPLVQVGIHNITCAGNAVFNGDYIINGTFNMAPGKSYSFDGGSTQTFNGNLNATGTGSQLIELKSNSPGSQFTFSKSTGCMLLDYIQLSDCKTTGGTGFFAGSHSVNAGNNTGWVFVSPSGCGIVWTGAVSNNWHSAGNWSNNLVPGSTSDLIIPAGMPNQPLISAAATCKDLTIMSGGVLTVAPAASLTVSGATSLGGSQCLILKSTAAGTASFIDNGTISGAGSAKIERYLTANAWHYVSKPVATATASVYNGQYLKKWLEPTYSWANIVVPSTALNMMEGYAVKSTTNKTFFYTGIPNTGAKTKSLTRNSTQVVSKRGWNLTGNPYPSAIDWDAASGWTKTNVNNAIYIYNQTYANYATYIGGLGTNGGTRYIAPGQGFFVICAPAATGTLAMNNNVRVHNNAPFMKSASDQQYIRLALKVDEAADEIIVRVDPTATTQFDADLDALRINEAGSLLWSQIPDDGSIQYAINSVDGVLNNPVIPVYTQPSDHGKCHITASDFDKLAAATGIWLEDRKTGSFTDLVSTPVYEFSSSANDDPYRFNLHFSSSTAFTGATHSNSDDIRLKPNPNMGQFIISVPESFDGELMIEVYDLPGKRIFAGHYDKVKMLPIDLGAVSAGTYYLKIISGEKTGVLKFVVTE